MKSFDLDLSVPSWKWDHGSPKLISALSNDVINRIIKKLGSKILNNQIDLKIRYKNFELGAGKQILSGGNIDLDWGLRDASTVLLTNKKIGR